VNSRRDASTGELTVPITCHPETAEGHEVPEEVEGPPEYMRRFSTPARPLTYAGGPSTVLRRFASFGGSG